MNAWFWVALAEFPFALVGAWYVQFIVRSTSGIRLMMEAEQDQVRKMRGGKR